MGLRDDRRCLTLSASLQWNPPAWNNETEIEIDFHEKKHRKVVPTLRIRTLTNYKSRWRASGDILVQMLTVRVQSTMCW